MIVLIVTLLALLAFMTYLAVSGQRDLEQVERHASNQSFEIVHLMTAQGKLERELEKARRPTAEEACRAAYRHGARKLFAQHAVIDHEQNTLTIDGVDIPWWLAMPGPEVDQGDHARPLSIINIPVYVDGVIEIRGENASIVDSVLGDVGEYARAKVRREMTEAYPWLVLP